ncbi:MAG: radical SAM protein, partial [Nanoarchaeota archaeon]|nr:radical SAM protein [Nanoarchaeota archaeon]
TRISNLWVKKNGKIYRNAVRHYIKNLDEIEFPDREIIYKYKKQANNPIKHFIATRGCPYKCTYCFNHQYHDLYKGKGPVVRYRSVDNLIREIKEVIKKYPTKFIYFQDDTIILDKKWIKEFCRKYRKEINLPFHCHIRANLLTEGVARVLSRAKCYSVHIAIEAGNKRIRDEILNRRMTNEDIVNACKLLKKYKIRFMTQNIIGLPTETLKEAIQTLKMNMMCKPTYAWVSIFQPYPGTKLGEFAKKQKLLTEDPAKIEKNFFDKSILTSKDKEKIEHLQKLFALTVDYPAIYKTGLLNILIRMPHNKLIKKLYKNVYQTHRKRSDYKLFGLKL